MANEYKFNPLSRSGLDITNTTPAVGNYRVFTTIADAKAASFPVENEMVIIKENRATYLTEATADVEDSPVYRVVEPSSLINNIKLRKHGQMDYNSYFNDEGMRLRSELAIGSITNPVEFVAGEGDSTSEGMLVYTYDGSTYTDVTADASSGNGSQFGFPNNLAGNIIYCTMTEEQLGIKFVPKGIKVKMNTAGSYNVGELIFEYFTGLTWVQLNVMSIKDIRPYYSYDQRPFQSTNGQSEQIYFNIKSSLDWADTDPMSLGTAYKWFRIRLTAPLATLPVFEQFKIHTSRTEINANGFVQKFGNSRVRKDLGWSLGDLEAANNSPANADVYASDTLGVGRIENLFQNGTTDRAAFNIRLPKDLDTSSPVKLRWSFTTDDAAGGDTRFVVRTAYTKDGDNVYRTTAGAPTVHPTQIDIIGNNTIPGLIDTQFTNEVEIDVSALNANPVSGSSDSDILWVSLERTGGDVTDTHSGDIAIISFDATYVSWAAGSFAAETQLTNIVDFSDDFESGSFVAGGWTVVPSANNANTWIVGTAQAESGTFGAYVSDDGTNATYSTSAPDSITHLYVDVAIPGTAVSANLFFNWLCNAEDGPAFDQYDFMKVYAVSTATTPVADTLLSETFRLGEIKYEGQIAWQGESITLPGSFIGSTVRLVFSFQSDFSIINNPGACIDNVTVSHLE